VSTALLDLQRRMAAAVMEPLGHDDVMRKSRRDGTSMADEAAAFIKPSDALTSFERLEIYNRQYWFRLFDSLEEDFPGLNAVLGPEKFDAVVRAYLAAFPSASYTLRDLGSHLAEFLQEEAWLVGEQSQLAIDVVRLEWAHIEAYDSASFPSLSPEFLGSISETTAIGLQPHVRLLQLSYPADEFMIQLRPQGEGRDSSSNNATTQRRIRPDGPLIDVQLDTVYLAVHRQEFTIYYKRLERDQYRMLLALQDGGTLGDLFSLLSAESTIEEEDQPGFFQSSFAEWSELSWLYDPSLARQPCLEEASR